MKEITVIAQNKPGEIAHLTEVLAAEGINIQDIDADTKDSLGVIHLVVDHYDKALRILSDSGFQAISGDALVIRLHDQPGALAQIAARFARAKINLRSMHIIQRESGAVLVSMVTDDNQNAARLVADVLVGRQ